MPEDLIPADTANLQEVIPFALRFSETGKPLTKGFRADNDLMAGHITKLILRANFILFRQDLKPGPTPGRCGAQPGHGT